MEPLAGLAGTRVLVTGGTGFLGEHVLRLGQAAGAHLWNLGSREGVVRGVNYLIGDLRDRTAIEQALDTARPAIVVHLAIAGGTYGSADFAEMMAVNVVGTDTLTSAMIQRGGMQLVATGTAYEYAERAEPLTEDTPLGPSNPYSITKAAASLVLGFHARELPTSLLRIFNAYGPGERDPRLLPFLVNQVREGRHVDVTACEQVRDFLYIAEAAEAVWRAALRPVEAGALRVLNVGTGKGVPLRRFVDLIVENLRRHGLNPDIRFGARPYRPGEAMHVVADVTRLRSTLGWLPSLPLETGVQRAVDSILVNTH